MKIRAIVFPMGLLAVDLDGDGTLEFAAGNKKGVHVIGR
jgi:hypothetical protein